MIFGYSKHKDYVDSEGNAWKPAMEFIVRAGDGECDDFFIWEQLGRNQF